MNIKKVKVKHPSFDRNIFILFIDNKLDRDSFEFLIYMARYGGHMGGIIGRTSHKGIVDKIGELYFHLNNIFGIKWHEASEFHIRIIRDRMVGLDKNLLINPKNKKNKKTIEYDTSDDKLRIWFKFYRYAQQKLNCDIILNYKIINKKNMHSNSMLSHISERQEFSNNTFLVEEWNLLFNKKKKFNSRNALSIDEFNALLIKLEEIDLVYVMMAIYAVKTALRIEALLKVKESDFDDFFKIIHSKTTSIQKRYIAKFDKPLYYTLSLDLLKIIKSRYLTRELPERLEKHYLYCKQKQKQEYNNDVFWIRSDGKEIKEYDFRNVLSVASRQLGKVEKNKIVPHTFRHTAATWKVLEDAKLNGLNLKNTGYVPPPIIKLSLQKLLGHSSDCTIMTYISTALDLMNVDAMDGIIRMPKREFIKSPNAQALLREKAEKKLGSDIVNSEEFDLVKYGINIGQVFE